MKKLTILSILASIALTGCGASLSSSEKLAPETISISLADETATDVLVGQTLQFVISSPTLGADLSVTWSVDNSTVASINENGLLSGISKGVAVVMAISKINANVFASKSVNVVLPDGYRVIDGTGTVVLETKEIYRGIIYAAQKSVSSNKYSVVDQDDIEVFRYSSVEKYYCYSGEKYVKTVTTANAAATFAKGIKNGYVIDNRGQNYTNLSQTIMPYKSNIIGELFSGSYMYHYSKTGADMGGVGFGYAKFTVEMSKMKMKFADDMAESGWNAYIFTPIVTTEPWSFCDVGLIAGGGSTRGYWNVVFNNNGSMHSVKDGLATIMEYNEADGYYHGKEDLELEIYVTQEAYCLNLTNIATGVTRHYEDPRPSNLTLNTSTLFIILSASYCPVTIGTKVWDPRCGLTMENIRFINPILKKYRSDAEYADSEAFPFMTGTEISDYTLLQQPDNLSYGYGTEDGKNYMEISIFYDIRERSTL